MRMAAHPRAEGRGILEAGRTVQNSLVCLFRLASLVPPKETIATLSEVALG